MGQHLVRLRGEIAVGIEQQLDALAEFLLPEKERVRRLFRFSHFKFILDRMLLGCGCSSGRLPPPVAATVT
jgi:hypothetical protein